MAGLEPIVTWIHRTNAKDNEVTATFDFGVVDADNTSAPEQFFLWNNYAGTVDVPKMEDITITTRDLTGGDGSQAGNIVEAVSKNWMQVRVESLGEGNFTPIGKGGTGTVNPSGTRQLGTNGETKNVNADTAVAWTANKAWALGEYVKPATATGVIYKVTTAGTGDTAEPTWNNNAGDITQSGTATFTAYPIQNKPKLGELLGLANNTAANGTGAANAAGNYAQFSIRAAVPPDATTGRNEGNFKVMYRFV